MNQETRLNEQRVLWKKRALMNLLAGLRAMKALGHEHELRKVTDCLAELHREGPSIARLELEVEKALTHKSMAPDAEGIQAGASNAALVQESVPQSAPVSKEDAASPRTEKQRRKQAREERRMMKAALRPA